MSTLLDIRNLSVDFATDGGVVHAVRDVTFTVGSGEIVAVVGESGSGKTVTGKTVLGLLPETADIQGSVLVGRDTGDPVELIGLSAARMRALRGTAAAMVFQEPSTALNPVFPIGWQIAEGIRAHTRVSKGEARTRAIEVLRTVGIPEPEKRMKDFPHQFSGGQKQRIVIAMALVLGAGLIVADEPTTALDVTVQAEILDLLRTVRDDLGGSILLITHNMGVVADLADRVVVMYQGEIVETADVATLFAAPQHEYTKKLLGAVPHIGQGRVQTAERVAARAADWAEHAPIVVGRGVEVVYPGRLGRADFTAVDAIDLDIRAGEVLGLVGESGSGKTTLGRAMAGLTPVTGGSLTVFGREMRGVRQRSLLEERAKLGFVFQDPATSFNPQLTIGEAVAEPLLVHGVAGDYPAARAKVAELLEAVRLPAAFADRFPHELSGGQRQRASLARSIALDPALLIADEPTSALDVSVQASVLDLFAELQREFGFACLFISHDLAVVDRVADRIAVLHHGRIVEQGPGSQVLDAPEQPYTQRLLASLPVPDPAEQASRRETLRALSA